MVRLGPVANAAHQIHDHCGLGIWQAGSVADVLKAIDFATGVQTFTLNGSGGGTLAVLMAERMPEVDQLVTIAANLDTHAWTRYDHFSTMSNSLNPATEIKTATPIKQIHFMGTKDDNIPPELGYDFLTRIGQQAQLIDNADHNCCWRVQWPALLLKIEQQINSQ
jgi:hypothetical protein